MKRKTITLLIVFIFSGLSLWADYNPQGYNSVILKARAPFENAFPNSIYLNTAFSLGGYLDFGWVFSSQERDNSAAVGLALSLKGMILSQSTTVPFNIELNGYYGFLHEGNNFGNFYLIENAYYRTIQLGGFLAKVGPLMRFSGLNDDYHLFYGGIFGFGLTIAPNMILALDNRLVLSRSFQLVWEPEILYSITLIE